MIGWNQPAGQVHLAQSGRRREWAPTHAICLSAVGLLVSILLSYSPVLAAETGAPTRTIQEAVNRVMTILADPDWRKSERSRERKRLVVEAISGVIDYDEMAMRALGQEWKARADRDRKAFLDAFRQFMESSYEGRFKDYSGEDVRYLGEQVAGNFAEVRTRLVSRKVDLPVNFRLVNRGEAWRVYDISVDGISLVGNYRAQFASIIREASFQALLVKLTSKAGDVAEPFEGPRPSTVSAIGGER
ncbi:MlaC/ttg2D family ABC transporter substrate-binding protein [Nitrospira defluvii]|uniref:Organic solvent tolerance ABC transporter substrate-binding protein n=1 Tax=Nitrospira defluvii TaxID=330214 RepID=A0ABN7MG30_9BACT|nr:ABC transporter substrate-binding protein [Nitrospira defluvii]CAE6796842.1 putative Organic solvent tolerance ABC transporter substrate-binding protein [Nitrospira defluvii]